MTDEKLSEGAEVTDGMLRWEPGSLDTRTIERIATDALADLWRDCYRRGDNFRSFQRTVFIQKLADIVRCATGDDSIQVRFDVIEEGRRVRLWIPRKGDPE